jgi:hypothetical protein
VCPPGGPHDSRDEGGREAGALMGGLAVRESVTLAGLAEQARVARSFVEGVLGPGHPCRDVAALLVGELFSNSLLHGGSGAPGETVTVAATDREGQRRNPPATARACRRSPPGTTPRPPLPAFPSGRETPLR